MNVAAPNLRSLENREIGRLRKKKERQHVKHQCGWVCVWNGIVRVCVCYYFACVFGFVHLDSRSLLLMLVLLLLLLLLYQKVLNKLKPHLQKFIKQLWLGCSLSFYDVYDFSDFFCFKQAIANGFIPTVPNM